MRAVAVLLGALAASSGAQAQDLGGFAMVKASALDSRPSPLDPGRRLPAPPGTLETAILAQGQVDGLHFRARAASTGGLGDAFSGNWPQTPTLALQSLYVNLPPVLGATVRIGKQVESWDQGLSYTPLGFFRTNPNVTDPLDTEGRVEGVPLVRAAWITEKLSVEAVAGHRLEAGTPAQDRNEAQAAVRLSGPLAPEWEGAVIVREREGAPPGAGLSLSYAHDRYELHFDGYYGPPEARMQYAGVYAPVVPGGDPFAQALISRTSPTFDFVLGGAVTLDAGWSLRAEFDHRGDGQDASGWNTLLSNIGRQDALLQAAPALVRARFLAYETQLGQGPQRRDYLFLGLARDGDLVGLSAYSLVGLADGGATTSLTATYKATQRIDIALFGVLQSGGGGSETGLGPVGGLLALRVIRRFG